MVGQVSPTKKEQIISTYKKNKTWNISTDKKGDLIHTRDEKSYNGYKG